MAKRLAIPSAEVKLRIVGTFNYLDVPRVQRVTLSSDIPTTDVFELGNNTLAGTATDIPNITVAFSAFDVGVRVFSVLTGVSETAWVLGVGVNIDQLSEVDAVLYIKDATTSDFVKSAHARRMQVRDFSFSYSVDGESTEDYTLIGSARRWFKNDVMVDRFTTGGTTHTLTETPLVLKNGDYTLSVILDGVYLDTETVGAPTAAGEYSVNAGTKVVTTFTACVNKIIVVYHAHKAGTNWTYINDPNHPAAIRGKDVEITIAAADIPRVQSVTINGNLNVQPVREMSNDEIVGYQRQTPTVDGTITVLDTDTELLDLLINGSASADTEFEIGITCTPSGVPLKIELQDPCTDTVLKTVYIPEIVLTGDSWASNVNQNATYTLNWKSNTAECVIFSGSM